MTVKLVPIYEPVVWTLADIQEAMREGEDLYQRRLAQAREMLAEREKDIPSFVRHTPCAGEYTRDERALHAAAAKSHSRRWVVAEKEVSTTCRCQLSK